MALQFPTSPSDGDKFGKFVYNSARGVWDWDVIEGDLYCFEYVIAAGGGGTSPSPGYGSGAGAGGYRSAVNGENSGRGNTASFAGVLTDGTAATFAEPPLFLATGSTFSVVVGAGGGAYANGSPSQLSGILATGGGRGANVGQGYYASSGGCGGSGGNQGLGIQDQGYDGAVASSSAYGGAGAGSGPSGGNGGAGVTSSITGSAVERCAGGGGEYNGSWTNGAANTGNGAKSGNYSGGSGVVIVRYPSSVSLSVGAGLTSSTTTVGNYKVTQFTAGSDTVTIGAI